MSVRSKLIKSAGWCLLFVPVLITAVICIRTAVNIPYEDDYDSILDFLLRYIREPGWLYRMGWILTAQHVQYKLWFLNSIVALQYEVTGHVQFAWLQQIGNAFVFLTAYLFWRMLATSGRSLTERIWLFCPIGALIFTLQYGRTMNWAMAGLQNLTVIPFAILTFFSLAKIDRRKGLALGMAAMVLSIACSGNGFFVAAVGALQLLLQRRMRAFATWCTVVVAIAAAYFIHYAIVTPGEAASLSGTLLVETTTPFLFLGAVFTTLKPAFATGLLAVALFLVLVRRGWYRTDPVACAYAAFSIVTALGVAITRRRMGIGAGLSDRYHMYALFMIAALYLGVLKTWLPVRRPLPRPWRVSLIVFGCLCYFKMATVDLQMYKQLMMRKLFLESHLILWEQHPSSIVLMPDEDFYMKEPGWIALRIHFAQTMRECIASGIYVPPLSAKDPIPLQLHPYTESDLKKRTMADFGLPDQVIP
jgi:hypothetical protein